MTEIFSSVLSCRAVAKKVVQNLNSDDIDRLIAHWWALPTATSRKRKSFVKDLEYVKTLLNFYKDRCAGRSFVGRQERHRPWAAAPGRCGDCLALSITHKENLAVHAPLIFNVVLDSTIFYEVVGPVLTKHALKSAGEISEDPS